MKRRGHYCWVCERVRSNESFSGRGHRDHVCNECKTVRRLRVREMRSALDGDRWDRQLERDVSSGRLDDLIDEARSEHSSGRTRPL